MEKFFLQIVNISLVASWLILAVLFLRICLKHAPKWITTLLWGFVAIRLIFPFSIESALSLVPSAKPLPDNFISTANPYVNSGMRIVDMSINPVITNTLSASDQAVSANPTQIAAFVCSRVWIIGIILMLGYAFLSAIRLKRKLRTATLYAKGIKQSEQVQSPFVFGLFKPMIYLPYNLSEKDLIYVIGHEQAHIKRKDHFWKPLGFLLLSVYWFNPLVWVAYIFLCRDIETACDEKVIKGMEVEERRAYSTALLECSIKKKMITACPVAFGENGVKTRIKDVMNYKKPTFWIILVAVIACIAVAVCFMTNPKSKSDGEFLEKSKQVEEPQSNTEEAETISTETTDIISTETTEIIPTETHADLTSDDFTEEMDTAIIFPKEFREILGWNLFLPGNSNWVMITDMNQEGDHSVSVNYYDGIMDAECTLFVVKQEDPWQWKTALGISENWEGQTADGTMIPISLAKTVDGRQFYCTWNYQDCWYSIYGDVSDVQAGNLANAEANKGSLTDVESAAKIAIFMIQTLSQYEEIDLSSSFRWGDERDWMCGVITKISTAGYIGVSQRFFVSDEDLELREKLHLTDDDFPDGYAIVSVDSLIESVDYPFATDCRFEFIDWHHNFDEDDRVTASGDNIHVVTTDYFVFLEYLAEYTNLDYQVFFYDIQDGEIVSVYETWLP